MSTAPGPGAGPLRVVHVTQPTRAGVANWLVEISADQVGRGWEVIVLAPEPLEGLHPDVSLRTWAATREPGPNVAAELRSLRRLLRAAEPDVVHLHASKAGLVGRLALRGSVPTIYQPHGWSFLATSPRMKPVVVRWERLAWRWTDVVVCVSQAEAETGRAHGIGGRFSVIPNGVDVERWRPAGPAGRAEARAALGVGDDRVAVCMARLCLQKGQDVLLDAWPSVRAAVPNARLLLVGDGPDQESLVARREPRVEFLGWREDVAAVLSAADVVVAPSRWEGLSLAVLEALASGRPVVATDVEGMREAVLEPPAPAGGIVVPPEDPEALATALVELLGDGASASALGDAARRRVVEANDARVALESLATLTSSLVPSPRAAAGATGRVPRR